MLVRPSLVLQANLLPEDYSEDTAEEIKRCCIYQAQALVNELDESECADGNIMRLSIRLMRPYWDASDPKAQELWDGVMPQWLRNMARNVSTIMHNYNTVRHPGDAGNVVYSWVDFEFGNHMLLRIKVDAENRITPEAPEFAQMARRLANEGAFGEEEVAMIRIPSAASYERQLHAAIEAAEVEAVEAASEELVEEAICEADAVDVVVAPEPEEEPEFRFDIDFSIWGIEYADGRVLELDTSVL